MAEIEQLNQAKQHILQNPQTLSQVLPIIIQVASASTDLQTQQWCSTFFIDITTPENKSISFFQKQDAASMILPTLMHLSKINDILIFKNVILTMTNIYDMIFDLVAKTSNKILWHDFDELKKFIILQWSTTYPLTPSFTGTSNDKEIDESKAIGVKLAIIKFISKIIVIQTTNIIPKDPRRPNSSNNKSNNSNKICIANISESHSVISKNVLDAEAQGLLDVLCNYLNEEEYLIPQKFIAVLNALVIILQKRYQSFSTKIINAIMGLNISSKYQFSQDSNLKFRLAIRYVERYYKNLLNYILRANLLNQSNQHYSKAQKIISDINYKMDSTKKRGILTDLNNNDSQHSRKKIKLENPPLPPSTPSLLTNDNSYASLYRLIESNNDLCSFDVTQIPQQTLSNVAIAALLNTDQNKLISVLSIVSARYADLMSKTLTPQPQNPPLSSSTSSIPPPPPSTTTVSSASTLQIPTDEQVKSEAIDDTEKDDAENQEILQSNENQDADLDSTYILPPPPALTLDDKKRHLAFIIENFFKISNYKNDQAAETIDDSLKINKIAISNWSKNSWLIILTRLATRGLADQDLEGNELSDLIRESIFQYFLENIHERIDIIIEWLNEEWYAEFNKNYKDDSTSTNSAKITSELTPVYLKWTEKVLDSMIPFLETNDRKLFIRFLSDLPFLNDTLVEKLKSLCIDPERSSLGFQALQFLIMFKPPVKGYCIEILKDLFENNEDLKDNSLKILKKYLPEEYADKE